MTICEARADSFCFRMIILYIILVKHILLKFSIVCEAEFIFKINHKLLTMDNWYHHITPFMQLNGNVDIPRTKQRPI